MREIPPTLLASALVLAAMVAGCAADGGDGVGNSLSGTLVSEGGCPITRAGPGCGPASEDGGGGSDPDGGSGQDASDPGSDGASGRILDANVPQADSGQSCRESEMRCPGGCNGHDGSDPVACLAAGNHGGCTEEMFQGWCHRRVEGNGQWEIAVEGWVANRCSGTRTLQRGLDGYDEYVCREASTCVTFRCSTPLVLVFEPSKRVSFRADDGKSEFDLAAPGEARAVRTDWPTAATPWLALDRDGDGRITSGRELFGSATPIRDGVASNGFQALAALDSDHDGDVDTHDAAYASLVLWSDVNGDRLSSPSELQSLSDAGVLSLDVNFRIASNCDGRGNCERERAGFSWRDRTGGSHDGAIVDVHLRVR